ncbi:hypothetical protein N7495_008106 [Penicillium taxi]|uniref:uncharacterized protein n=1 Tax=Penicillium taxi TaxID=168475 RepID=UPI002544E3EF|nr:uncharacterized protein N7495_008106 [Penicillium taxi]KAJ5888065.1 hypothetical protein N7495_008106 [Penicillium taxi]
MQSTRNRDGRLRPVGDPLVIVGYASKGDKTLLEHHAQKEYFHTIVERWLRFCSDHNKHLDDALASLPLSSSTDATSNPPAAKSKEASTETSGPATKSVPPSMELSTLLLSLRKLREGITASAVTTPIEFSQRVHYFSIRLSILAHHPPSYFPSLRHCLDQLHSASHPFAHSEIKEMYSYLILDYACRQDDMAAAFRLRARARQEYGFQSQNIDRVLLALIHGNWIMFWKVCKKVDSYLHAIMKWAVDRVRRNALKSVGSAYLSVPIDWVLGGCTGDDESWTWEKLAAAENLKWEREKNDDDDRIIIRRPRRPKPQLQELEQISEQCEP